MQRKRQRRNVVVDDYHSNKKRKLQNEMTTINTKFRSRFEDLANEILYEVFEYLDIYHVYDGFFNLNKRFQNLLMNSNLSIKINVSAMSKSNFEHYYKDIILPNKHRINCLRLSNPFTIDIVFSPPRIITKFVRLETLIFHNIDAKYLHNILNQSIHLPKLHSLVITLADCVQDPNKLFLNILRLPRLKYCKITYQTKKVSRSLEVCFDNCEVSPIEHLVMNCRFPIDSFNRLLCYVPELRHLSIDCLIESNDTDIKLCPILLKHLKYVSLNIDNVLFNGFELLVKNYFHSIEVLRLTTRMDQTYLNANRWEKLILSSMPNLRIFDFHHDNSVFEDSPVTYHDLVHQFTSQFWIERQWFFTHQHDWRGRIESGIFYSTNPYRRKDYTFYWELDKQICPHLQENNLNSVKRLLIRNKRTTSDFVNYFPNATELTISYCFERSDEPFIPILHRIVPLEHLTKLHIGLVYFPFEQMVELISLTPNLHTLKLHVLFINETCSKLIKQTDIFRYVLKTNKITNLEFNCPTLKDIQFLVDLFPRLEYIKIGMDNQRMKEILRFLFTNISNKLSHLFFLCIDRVPKRYLQEFDMLLKSENLLNDYFIKLINRQLYLWWSKFLLL
ncbi:unnamed protein product [Rotaria sordida]|uniref:F-box domain-containing protein n=1 Tax=Rotaria sordida TaxID=392033 RepID=A0A815CB00_9BILA|nr:unnamed protein product [Rotaria sordida]